MSGLPWQRYGVLVVLADGPHDVTAAALAADLARARETRVLAAVVLTASGSGTTVPALRRDAAAVSGRVQPRMAARDVALTAVPLLLPSGSGGWSSRRLARTLRLLLRRSGAEVVVLPDVPLVGIHPGELAAALPSALIAYRTATGPDALARR